MPPPRPVPPQKKGALHSSSGRINTRKSHTYGLGAGLDLNPSAHPRTDPVNALNILLKLLISLPSRIGGCQYKLTQAEHALSLHLVSIIDPFVYHGVRTLAPPSASNTSVAAFSSLIDQPTEILDAILFHVDSRKDLLNTALVCKRLHSVVFPRHIDYCVIRCKVSSISVWNHLVAHKSLARNVRRLEIVDERAAVGSGVPNTPSQRGILIPRGISRNDTDLESTDDELRIHLKQERFLSAALLHMTGLKDFKWSSNHSPISIANVWPTLMKRATSLSSIEICDNLVFGPRPFNDDEGSHTTDSSESDFGEESHADLRSLTRLMEKMPSSFLDLTNVTFRSTPRTYGAAKQPELNRISKMLHQCPGLKSLEITYVPLRNRNTTGGQGVIHRTRPLADDFFTYSRWPYTLTSLTLTNLRCSSPPALVNFLFEHPVIEVLHLDIIIHSGNFSAPNCLPRNSLPLLREVKASKEIVNAILECPSDNPRPLAAIKGFKLSGHPTGNAIDVNSSRSIGDAVFLSNLKNKASNIRTIELSAWHDMEEIRKLIPSIPNVQHLDLGKKLGAMARRNGHMSEKGGHSSNTGPASNIIEWIDLLSTLPELTTLRGVKFFYEISSALTDAWVFACDSSTSALTTACANSSKQSHAMQMSTMERSRMRKNDEIAGVLAWKCGKLRWIDHWDEGSGKIIQLLRDHHASPTTVDGGTPSGKDKGRWEVRRVKS